MFRVENTAKIGQALRLEYIEIYIDYNIICLSIVAKVGLKAIFLCVSVSGE